VKLILLLCSSMLLVNCSEENATGVVPADLDAIGQEPLSAASDAELRRVCSWSSQLQGGYGRTVSCPGSKQKTDPDEGECVAGLQGLAPLCDLQVLAITSCVATVGEDLCKFASEGGCAKLRECLAKF